MSRFRILNKRLLWKIYIFAVFGVATANPDAKRLYDDLMSSYNRLIRPVVNNSDTLTVRLGLKLSQLIDVGNSENINLLLEFNFYKKKPIITKLFYMHVVGRDIGYSLCTFAPPAPPQRLEWILLPLGIAIGRIFTYCFLHQMETPRLSQCETALRFTFADNAQSKLGAQGNFFMPHNHTIWMLSIH